MRCWSFLCIAVLLLAAGVCVNGDDDRHLRHDDGLNINCEDYTTEDYERILGAWVPSTTALTPIQLRANPTLERSYLNVVKVLMCKSLANLFLGTAPMATDVQIHGPTETVNGVTPECRSINLNAAMEIEFHGFDHSFNNSCPFAGYGAAIVDRTDISSSNLHDSAGNNCGKILETNTGFRDTFTHGAYQHSELNAIIRLSTCSLHPEYCDSNGNFLRSMDKVFYGKLDLYTTVASCIEDWAAEELSGFDTVVQGPTLRDIISAGWTQNSIWEPELNLFLARQPFHVKHLIKDVRRIEILPHFTWQFTNATTVAAVTCPIGCHSTAPNACANNS